MNATKTQTVTTAASEAAASDSGEPGDSTDQSPSSADSADSDIPPEPAASVDPQIDVMDDRALAGSPPVDGDRIARLLRAAAALLDRSVGRVSVRLIDQHQMTALHHQALGDPIITDVLSFDATGPGATNRPIEVDIAVCVDVAADQAELRGHHVERELLLYALHGLLHCCGYDDHDASGFRRIHDEEDRILAAIGVGPTFADHGDHTDGD